METSIDKSTIRDVMAILLSDVRYAKKYLNENCKCKKHKTDNLWLPNSTIEMLTAIETRIEDIIEMLCK